MCFVRSTFLAIFIPVTDLITPFVLVHNQFDVRKDEEQDVKLDETVRLLLAAGYFRARIKALSPFDKVHGMFLLVSCHAALPLHRTTCLWISVMMVA